MHRPTVLDKCAVIYYSMEVTGPYRDSIAILVHLELLRHFSPHGHFSSMQIKLHWQVGSRLIATSADCGITQLTCGNGKKMTRASKSVLYVCSMKSSNAYLKGANKNNKKKPLRLKSFRHFICGRF